MCYPICGMMHIKEPLLLIGGTGPDGAVANWLVGTGFAARVLKGPMGRCKATILSDL